MRMSHNSNLPVARAPTPTRQCSQLRRERTRAPDRQARGGPANTGGVQISQRRAAGMRCAAGQPTLVSEGHRRSSLASGGRHRTVTGGSDAAPAAARIGLVAASAIRPRRSGTNPDPCLQITSRMTVIDHLCRSEAAGGLRVTAGGGHCCSSVLCGKGWDSGVAMPVWPYAQLTTAAGSRARSQDDKRSGARCEVVPVPDRQPAGLGRYRCPQ